MARRYWLFKSEPGAYSFEDLQNEPKQTAFWDGVRNYQARNLLRDDIKKGDGVLFYHSNAKPCAIMGIARVTRGGYPDPTQFDPAEKYFDPKSDPDDPRWFVVDITYEKTFGHAVTLEEVKAHPELQSMMLAQRGARLSVQPVTNDEWKVIQKLGSSSSQNPGPASPPARAKKKKAGSGAAKKKKANSGSKKARAKVPTKASKTRKKGT